MYNVKYQYEPSYFPGFTKFLEELYERSWKEYLSTIGKDVTAFERKNELQQINNFIGYLEDYVVALTELGIINANNIKDVLNEIKKIKSISVLPKDKRGVYGITYFDYRIEINPNLRASKYLTSEERTLLYIGHEVGHIIHKMWLKDAEGYFKIALNNPNLKKLIETTSTNNKLCINDGFSLIDEATVQELAEQVVYHISKKQRPPYLNYSTRDMYDGEIFSSNFDYYKELEDPAILFGRTLRGIGKSKLTSDADIISELAKRSFNKSFISEIIEEYNETPSLQQDLFNTLICLGRIKDASYGRFGKSNFPDSTFLSKQYFSNLKFFCKKNEDYRPKVIKKI